MEEIQKPKCCEKSAYVETTDKTAIYCTACGNVVPLPTVLKFYESPVQYHYHYHQPQYGYWYDHTYYFGNPILPGYIYPYNPWNNGTYVGDVVLGSTSMGENINALCSESSPASNPLTDVPMWRQGLTQTQLDAIQN